jgi:hypothetical protein
VRLTGHTHMRGMTGPAPTTPGVTPSVVHCSTERRGAHRWTEQPEAAQSDELADGRAWECPRCWEYTLHIAPNRRVQ